MWLHQTPPEVRGLRREEEQVACLRTPVNCE